MAIVWIRELQSGVNLRGGAAQDSWTINRTILVRVDAPYAVVSGKQVSIHSKIAGAVGIKWGDPHYDPGLAAGKMRCSDISITAEGDGMLYRCEYAYTVQETGVDPATELPEPKWSFTSNRRSIPWEEQIDHGTGLVRPTTNSANDLIPGIEKEIGSAVWNVEAYYKTWAEALALAAHDNKVNKLDWGGGKRLHWLFRLRSISEETVPEPENTAPGDPANEGAGADGRMKPRLRYKVNFDLEHRYNSWTVAAIDAGMQEKCTAAGVPSTSGTFKQIIKDQGGRAVTRPVALDNGIAAPVGTTPKIVNGGLGFLIHDLLEFAPLFGNPPADLV
jgi:hypothetical protein